MDNVQQILTRIVVRNDSVANWESANPVLLKGEMGVATDINKIKIGDGIKTWKELSYSGISMDEVLAAVPRDTYTILDNSENKTDAEMLSTIVDMKQGDTVVIKTFIATAADGDKYSYTGYVYDGSAWGAMDGNYNAENVYFGEDIAITTAVGNITLSNGQGTIPAKGKNLKQTFESIWTKENTDPTVTNPSASITLNSLTADKSYEVGETVAISYTTSFSAGSYQFGPATGVTAKGYTVSNGTSADDKTTSTGSFDTITMADSNDASKDEYSSYRLSVVVSHTAATANAKTNLGNNTNKTIAEGSTTTAYSKYIKSYRKPFWGYKLSTDALVDPKTVDVRGLQKSGTSTAGLPTSYTVPADTKQVFFAAKKGTKSTITVKNASSLNAPVAFTKVTDIMVEGANSFDETAYDLWYANFDNATTGSAELTITWA